MKKIKILFLSSLPSDQSSIDAYQEHVKIELGIKSGRISNIFELPLLSEWNVRASDLSRILQKYETSDVIHFSGHGEFDGILLENGNGTSQLVDRDTIQKLFEATRTTAQLVVLNTCHSDAQASAIADVVGCAIGMPQVIRDDLAIQFAASFYRNLAFDCSIQQAFDISLIDLNLLGASEQMLPKLKHAEHVDPNKIFLTKRRGRILIADHEAWDNYVTILDFAKLIHHIFQTIISYQFLKELFEKIVALKEIDAENNLIKKEEAQNSFKRSWDRYETVYGTFLAELESKFPDYRQNIYTALIAIKHKNVVAKSTIKKCIKNVEAINGNLKKNKSRGELPEYIHHHNTVADYVTPKKPREISGDEHIIATIQDMKQLSDSLTTDADNLLRNLILGLLGVSE